MAQQQLKHMHAFQHSTVAQPPVRATACGRTRTHRRVSAAAVPSIGPAEPPPRRVRKPDWVRVLEADADMDEDVAQLLQGTDGDPDKIRDKMRAELSRKDLFIEGQGTATPPRVTFRQVDPFNLWIWFQFAAGPPSRREADLLQAVLQAWFMVGKMGGYNSQNMQVFYNAGDDQSFFEYDNDEVEQSQGSLLHDITELELQGSWARCRVDLGSCDELALDVLLNSLVGFSKDVVGLSSIVVGGRNKAWPVPDVQEPDVAFDIDPMQLPEGLDEELELLDALEAQGMLKKRKKAGDKSADSNPASDLLGDLDDDEGEEGEELGDGVQRNASAQGSSKAWGQSLMRKYSPDEFKRVFQSRQ